MRNKYIAGRRFLDPLSDKDEGRQKRIISCQHSQGISLRNFDADNGIISIVQNHSPNTIVYIPQRDNQWTRLSPNPIVVANVH